MLPGVGGAELRLLNSVNAGGAPRTATARTRSPSLIINSPKAAPQRFMAFSSKVSNTGARVAGRRVDDLQDLRRRGLLLQCLPRLGNEPRVLHCNDRLRREILEQRKLIL